MDRSIDYFIIIIYLLLVALVGIFSGGKQNTVKDYFLGNTKVQWWAVTFSIVAAETSTLTFISIPGLAYLTNLNFLQLAVGYIIGRVLVAYVLLPAYFRGELSTAYSFLEARFGNKTRTYASVVFLFTRTLADGVRLYATAIPLKLLLGIEYPVAIIIIAGVTLLYTVSGGVKGVIWVDVIQMFIYIGGAVTAGFFLAFQYIQWDMINTQMIIEKLSVINLGLDSGISDFFGKPYTLIGGIVGGTFLSMASHGTDQLIVQRLLATKKLKEAKKAVIGSGIIVFIQFAVFLLLGVGLYAYYDTLNVKSDEIFPMFIIEELPPGVSGIIIAGLFAAAMSTLAGSVSSLSSSTSFDLLAKFQLNFNEKKKLTISKYLTVLWTFMLTGSAFLFMNSSSAVVELALSIASFTYGGLLGTFLLGLTNKNIDQKSALTAFTISITGMVLIISFKLVAWTWFTFLGVLLTLIFGNFIWKVKISKKS